MFFSIDSVVLVGYYAYMTKTPSKRTLTSNILKVWDIASDDEKIEGADWYQTANTFAVGLHEKYDITIPQAAGIIAALSPQLRWDRNMAYADLFCRTGDAPTLGLSRRKAVRILSGEDISTVFAPPKSNPRSGAKVRAFYACILDPNCDEVCIDRHAFDIAHGIITDDAARRTLNRVGVYDAIRNAYRTVAARAGVSPSTVQATTWVTWRNNFSLTAS